MSDPSSLSNYDDCKVTSLKLVLEVDFKESKLKGYVEVFAQIQRDGVDVLALDSNNLDINSVKDNCSNSLQWKFGKDHQIFGKQLLITIPENLRSQGKEFSARVYYNTTTSSSALQWLTPEQTAGKKYPYLFSQCQAIHARSLVPCQDSPANKIKYQAEITVPKDLTALMSALSTGKTENQSPQSTTYTFTQEIPIPTYLIAIVAGQLESREIGPRTKVWSEPSMVDAGAYEFANTEKFIAIGEDLLTPYVWGRYDLLLLPPSFPYGGMENPLLTFLTPTLLAGDRSLENVVAHEIAHSWTGNLVTNKFWSEFFLNEGFTVFVERKIISRIYGEEMFDFEAMNGLKHLHDDIVQFGETNVLTALRPELEGIDPDDAFSSVPYEKGFNLLAYLQSLVGVKDFEAWLKQYITKFAYQSIVADQMKEFFIDYFTQLGKAQEISVVDWNAWFNTPGMPIKQVHFHSEAATKAQDLAKKWFEQKDLDALKDSIQNFKTQQIILFFDTLLILTENSRLSLDTIEKMDSFYQFTSTQNAEYKAKWYTLCLRHGLERIQSKVVDFLLLQGRMKFVRPLYRELNAKNSELAKSTFIQHHKQYHSIASKMVAKDLNVTIPN